MRVHGTMRVYLSKRGGGGEGGSPAVFLPVSEHVFFEVAVIDICAVSRQGREGQ